MSRVRGRCPPPSTPAPLLMGLLEQLAQSPTHWGCKATEISLLPVLEARDLSQDVSRATLPPRLSGSPSHLSLPCGDLRLIETALHPPSVFTWPTFLGLATSRSLSKGLPNQHRIYDHKGQRAGVSTGSVPTAGGDTGSGGNERAPQAGPQTLCHRAPNCLWCPICISVNF